MASRRFLALIVVAACSACAGRGLSGDLVNPKQPKDLGSPWVNKTTSQWGASLTQSDELGNHVFRCETDEFDGLVRAIAEDFNGPIAVKPKAMLEWNLTIEVKGKDQEQVLRALATQCRLNLGKSSSGCPLLTYPGVAGEEFLVKPGDGEDGTEKSE